MKTEFVQKAHKPVQTHKIDVFLQRRTITSMEIHAISRLTLARNNPCTNESSIPTRSWGYRDFKNVKTEFVQKAHKQVEIREIDLFLQRRIMPSMEIHATSRLTLSGTILALMKVAYLQEAGGMGSSKMYRLSLCKLCTNRYTPAK